ncbi:transposase related protein [Thermoplasma acidophilum]|uniref:Transposase related protein n=1 Tax=Thermoplasma acidophilum (strain ATCC 25905 / DSM 1728 / JCM 9062 / NBRC 15155 / AMRC-C165) TaxID=273075 RepID=Q9HKA4_THEAC|nr:transposase [Thermoplasma acidophilum]CAC11835.1 transposase related protein [Thermoplasma acidophilum]
MRQIYPISDFQLCTVHASRNFESKIRVSDRDEADTDLKGIFLSGSKDESIRRLNDFKSKWLPEYMKPIYIIGKNLGVLLEYCKFPRSVKRSIHSTNIIERINKEIRRRIKIIDSLPSEENIMNITYLRLA